MAQSRKNKAANQRAFLAAVEETGCVLHAARAAGIDRWTHYQWMKEPGEAGRQYRKRFKDAKRFSVAALEVEARRRGKEGVHEPVIYKGQLAGIWVNKRGDRVAEGTRGAKFVPLTIKKFSDVLLITLLNANNPKKFRPRKDELPKSDPAPPPEQIGKEIIEYLGEDNVDGST